VEQLVDRNQRVNHNTKFHNELLEVKVNVQGHLCHDPPATAMTRRNKQVDKTGYLSHNAVATMGFYLSRISFAVVIAKCLGGSLFGTHCGINTYKVQTSAKPPS